MDGYLNLWKFGDGTFPGWSLAMDPSLSGFGNDGTPPFENILLANLLEPGLKLGTCRSAFCNEPLMFTNRVPEGMLTAPVKLGDNR